MEEKKIWEILEIQPTKDEDAIRQAYRKKLIHTNPEDDQEGFKLLRESYEEALRLSRTKEETEEETPVSLWMKRVEACYNSLKSRRDLTAWKDIMSDEVCEDLDTSDEACEALLVFLMNHYYLHQEIWQLIDKVFCIRELKESLCEKFPANFIDYIISQIENKNFFDLNFFEGPDDGDYDSFIKKYFDLKFLVDEEKTDEAEKLLIEFDQSPISHPMVETERMRLAFNKKNMDEAKKIADSFSDELLHKVAYISYYTGIIRWESGDTETAATLWREILKEHEDYYPADRELVRYELKKGEYKAAKDRCIRLLDKYGGREELVKLLEQINEKLLEVMEPKWRQMTPGEQEENESLRFEMGWCYYQNKRFEEGEKILDYEPSEEHIYEFNNLKGRILFSLERYEQALPLLKKWLEIISTLEEDGTEETKKRIERKAYACVTIGTAYEKLEQYEEAEKYFVEGSQIDNPDNICNMNNLAELYLKTGEYEKCVDICTTMTEQYSDYYPAYLYRQKAYYYLKDGQKVIDDFYAGCQWYAGYYEAYMFAMKVFIDNNQIKDALDIYEKARENQIESLSLEYYKNKCYRINAATREELEKVAGTYEALREKAGKEKNDLKDPSKISRELAIVYMRLEAYDKAMQYIDEAIKLNKDKPEYIWIKGNISGKMRQYEQALKCYNQITPLCQDNANLIYDKAVTLRNLGREKEAVSCFKRVLELDEGHTDAAGELSAYYHRRYKRTESMEDYERAKMYIHTQMENYKSSYYLIEAGLLYFDGKELDQALEAFDQAIEEAEKEKSSNIIYAYCNKAKIYWNLEDYDTAMALCDWAIQHMEGAETVLPYYNKAVTCLMKNEYQKAVDTIKEGSRLFPESGYLRTLLEKALRRMSCHREVLKLYREDLSKYPDQKDQHYEKIAEVYASKKNPVMAIYYYKRAISQDEKNPWMYYYYANYLKNTLSACRQAVNYYLDALVYAQEGEEDCISIYEELIDAWVRLNDKKTAQDYFNKMLEMIKKHYNSLEDYINYPLYAPSRHYQIGRIYLCLGNLEEAKKYIKDIFALKKCDYCRFGKCYEALMLKGMLCEAEGSIEQAYKCYLQARENEVNDDYLNRLIRRADRQLKEKKK